MVAAMAGTPTSARFGGYSVDKSEAGMHPAKLFIGGITRHTTTKQLRDHFSRYGRVLDCVAMRQPDGRPRGFGYVTLDSMAAADRCLAEKQIVDGRVVDMKRAVPEGSGSPMGAAAGGMLDYGHTPDSCLGAPLRVPPPPASLYGEWPDASAMGLGASPYFGMLPAYEQHISPTGTSPIAGGEQPWGCYTPQTPDTSGDAPDCVELLSRRGMLQHQQRLAPARGDASTRPSGRGRPPHAAYVSSLASPFSCSFSSSFFSSLSSP
ncbi:unnamed protein product [Prorocentrum cordatum]|uniref:RRM domain-containing protein n=1 Tax=Prorocentrum cordatum TaxID=2364126 RepID=A0ABN9WXU3_9DINO|nr:unnamed protein product [Polarella glacialis]